MSDRLTVIGLDGTPATTIDSAGVISLMEQRGALQLEAAALRNTLRERDREIERMRQLAWVVFESFKRAT